MTVTIVADMCIIVAIYVTDGFVVVVRIADANCRAAHDASSHDTIVDRDRAYNSLATNIAQLPYIMMIATFPT